MVKIILITHGNFGQALLKTASSLSCFQGQDISVISISGKVNLEEVENKIKNLCMSDTLILVDVFGGTACNVALKCSFGKENVFVICGLNLNMLITASHNNGKLPLKELCNKIILDGKKAVFEATEFVKK